MEIGSAADRGPRSRFAGHIPIAPFHRSNSLLADPRLVIRVLRGIRTATRKTEILSPLDIDNLDAVECMPPLNHGEGIFVAVQVELLAVDPPQSKPFLALVRALLLGNLRLVIPE